MIDNDLISACLKYAEADNKNGLRNNLDVSKNLSIKVVQLEQFPINSVGPYLQKICNNQMTVPTLEVILAIIRLYSYERLPEVPHLSNPQAYSVLKDMEDFLLQKLTEIMLDNKENLIVSKSKVDLLLRYMKNRYYCFYFKLCKLIK